MYAFSEELARIARWETGCDGESTAARGDERGERAPGDGAASATAHRVPGPFASFWWRCESRERLGGISRIDALRLLEAGSAARWTGVIEVRTGLAPDLVLQEPLVRVLWRTMWLLDGLTVTSPHQLRELCSIGMVGWERCQDESDPDEEVLAGNGEVATAVAERPYTIGSDYRSLAAEDRLPNPVLVLTQVGCVESHRSQRRDPRPALTPLGRRLIGAGASAFFAHLVTTLSHAAVVSAARRRPHAPQALIDRATPWLLARLAAAGDGGLTPGQLATSLHHLVHECNLTPARSLWVSGRPDLIVEAITARTVMRYGRWLGLLRGDGIRVWLSPLARAAIRLRV